MDYNFAEFLGCLRLPILIVDCDASNHVSDSTITVIYANPISLKMLRVKDIYMIDIEHLFPLLNAELLNAKNYSLKTCNIAESLHGQSYTLCVSPLVAEHQYIVEFYPEDISMATFCQSNPENANLTQVLKHEIINKIIREAGLIKENEYFKRLLNDLPVLVALKDSQLRYRYVNQSFCDFVHKTPKEIIGKTDFDICTADEAEYFRSIDRDVMEADRSITTEDTYTDIYNVTRHLLTTKTPVRDSDGNLNVQLVCVNITELHQLKSQLQSVKDKYEEMADLAGLIIWILDANMKHTFISPSIEMFQGYTPDEFLNMELTQSMTPESMALAAQYQEKIIDLYSNNRLEDLKMTHTAIFDYYHKDGSIVSGECKFAVIMDSNNQLIGVQGVTRKIKKP
jgi:PAS domain S-box-containing protein